MLKVELMTAKERQLWYWRQEMESCHRNMNIYPADHEKHIMWKERYENAIRTYNALSGENLRPQEDAT